MRGPLRIQDIEEMRRRAGIEDVELRQAIRGLRVGALVKITLLARAPGLVASRCWSGSPASGGAPSAAS